VWCLSRDGEESGVVSESRRGVSWVVWCPSRDGKVGGEVVSGVVRW
jgi:hypothetical protein